MAIDQNKHTLVSMGNSSFDENNQKNQVEVGTVNPATGKFEPSTEIDAAQMIIEDASETIKYIGKNSTLTASTSDNTWIITKIDTTIGTVIKKTTGSWDNRATLFS